MFDILENIFRISLLNVREYCRLDSSRKPPEVIKKIVGDVTSRWFVFK